MLSYILISPEKAAPSPNGCICRITRGDREYGHLGTPQEDCLLHMDTLDRLSTGLDTAWTDGEEITVERSVITGKIRFPCEPTSKGASCAIQSR